MRNVIVRSSVVLLFALVVHSGSAWAQGTRTGYDALVAAGPVQMWDDEGSLGMTMGAGAGIGYRFRSLALEALVDHSRHHPDFGNNVVFKANGTRVMARVLYYFRDDASVRPYVGGALGYGSVSRLSEFPEDCRFVDHQLVCQGTRRFESTDRSRAVGVIGGVRVAAGDRWFVRPEFELGHSKDSVTMRGMVAVGRAW